MTMTGIGSFAPYPPNTIPLAVADDGRPILIPSKPGFVHIFGVQSIDVVLAMCGNLKYTSADVVLLHRGEIPYDVMDGVDNTLDIRTVELRRFWDEAIACATSPVFYLLSDSRMFPSNLYNKVLESENIVVIAAVRSEDTYYPDRRILQNGDIFWFIDYYNELVTFSLGIRKDERWYG